MIPEPDSFVAGTEPYPWPYHGDVCPDRLCLLIAGVQRVHAEASVGAEVVAARIEEVADEVRRAGGIVCHLRHAGTWARRRPLLAHQGEGASVPVLLPSAGDLVVTTAGHDGFFASPLDDELRARGIELLVLVGMAAEVTVSSTRRSANDRGYECLTLADACAPLDESTGRHDLHSVTMSGGIFGAVGHAPALVRALATRPPTSSPATDLATNVARP